MLQSLKIEGFRGFQNFEMANLGRINLLVGKNNSGKTSILEAIQFLYAQNNKYLGKINYILASKIVQHFFNVSEEALSVFIGAKFNPFIF